MIFKQKAISEPLPGTTRIKKKFAWLPTRVNNSIVWLQSYEILYAYIIEKHRIIIDGVWEGVAIGKWLKVSQRTKTNI